MSEQKIGAAVFGAGWVAAEHIAAYQRNPHCEVVAVGSRRAESAQARAAAAGASEAAIYTSFEELLRDERVDAISICTPNHLHCEETVEAAEAGKHVIVEKPIAVNLDELRQVRDAVRAAGVRSVVSFVLRWNPSFLNTKALLAAGAIGEVLYAECDYWHEISDWYAGWEWIRRKDSGASSFLAAGCHAVDAIRWFVGDIVAVSAFAGEVRHGFEYPPTVVGTVRFANGAVGKLSSSFDIVAPYTFNVDLLGTRGTIRDNRLWSEVLLPGQNGWATAPCLLPDSGAVEHHPFQDEIGHFLECIRTGTESHVNIEDAVKTHEVCIAFDRSAANGGEVVRLPLLPA